MRPHRRKPTRLPVPGILQAGTLEWVAIPFSNARKWNVKVKSLSRVRLLATPWTAAYQAPPSMGFSRQADTWNYTLLMWSLSEFLRYLLLKRPTFLWRLFLQRGMTFWGPCSSPPLSKFWTKQALDVLWNPCHSDAFWGILMMFLFQPLTRCWCQKRSKSRSLNIALSAFVGRSEANGIYQRVIIFMNLFEF